MVRARVEAIDIDPKTGTTLGFYTFGEDKPNILIVAGMDGASVTDVYASYLIMKFLETVHRIDGSITVLPVANPLAFRLGVKVSPLDAQHLDSVFPGHERGTITERIAWEIWRRAVRAQNIIHLSTNMLLCISHVMALHRDYIHVRNLASQIALPLVVQSDSSRGALHVEASHEGIPAVKILMRGGNKEVEPQAAVEVKEAILNLLRIMDMIPGDRIEASSTLMGLPQRINCETEGFFVPTANLGEVVNSDDVIGQIQDKEKIRSPFAGAIVALSKMTYVFEGDVIAHVAAPLVKGWREETGKTSSVSSRRKW